MNIKDLVAIDIHTHAEVSCQRGPDEFGKEFDEAALANSDLMVSFASIDPHKGMMGVREARRLIADYKIGGFEFHPSMQGFFPNDRLADRLYDVIAEAGLPAHHTRALDERFCSSRFQARSASAYPERQRSQIAGVCLSPGDVD